MTDKTDGVLAVLRYAVSEAEYERERCDHFGVDAWRQEADQAVAAVAELLAADVAYDKAWKEFGYRGSAIAEAQQATIRRAAAIRAMRGDS